VENGAVQGGLRDAYTLQLSHDWLIATDPRIGGADLRRSLVVRRIPVMFEINHFVSAGTVAILFYFLISPLEWRHIQMFSPSLFDIRWLEFMGVRFVVTSKPVDGAGPPAATAAIGDASTAYLYELRDPNVGNYSPTRQTVVATAVEMLERMADPGFNPRRSVLLAEPVPGDLVPTQRSEIRFEGDVIRFRATSAGRSLVVLPFEFSRCLEIEDLAANSAGNPRLVRANLAHIGVIFDRNADIRIRFRFSPTHNVDCRSRDVADGRNLRFSGLQSFRGVKFTGGYKQ
jgi:hypothetical protein